jgi:hypothetical protein
VTVALPPEFMSAGYWAKVRLRTLPVGVQVVPPLLLPLLLVLDPDELPEVLLLVDEPLLPLPLPLPLEVDELPELLPLPLVEPPLVDPPLVLPLPLEPLLVDPPPLDALPLLDPPPAASSLGAHGSHV